MGLGARGTSDLLRDGCLRRTRDALMQAISPSLNGPGGCNEGFLRDDALLMITWLAPGSDQSKGTVYPWEWYDTVVEAKHGDPNSVIALSLSNIECPKFFDTLCEFDHLWGAECGCPQGRAPGSPRCGAERAPLRRSGGCRGGRRRPKWRTTAGPAMPRPAKPAPQVPVIASQEPSAPVVKRPASGPRTARRPRRGCGPS